MPVGLSLVQKNLKFRYKDLIINQHEAIRIEFTFVDLLEEEYSLDILATATIGLLVKSLASLIKAMLQDGMRKGTLLWDVLIMKALSLLLQSMTGARAGPYLIQPQKSTPVS